MTVAQQAAKGVAWTSLGKTIAQLVGAGTTLVLARLLTPEEFGLLAMAVVVTGFFGLLLDLGFCDALIQKADIQERHRSSVFWLTQVGGVFLTAALILLAPAVAVFFQTPELKTPLQIVGFDFLLLPFISVKRAVLAKEMNFRALAGADAFSALTSSIVALVMAFQQFGVWALIAKWLVASFALVLSLAVAGSWRPKLRLDRAALAELWRFSANLFGVSVLGFVARQIDDFLIGRVLGTRPLGLYQRAYNTMMMPVTEVGSVLTRVMFPALSKLQGQADLLRPMYLQVVGMIGLIIFPVMFGLSVLSAPAIVVLYGEQWTGAASVLSICCVVGAFQAVGSTTPWIFKSQGRADLLLRWTLVAALVLIAGMVAGLTWGGAIEWVAVGFGTGYIALGYHRFAIPGRLIGMSFGDVFARLQGVLLCALLMAAGVWGLGRLTEPRLSSVSDLAVRTAVGGIMYLVLLRAIRPAPYQDFRRQIRTKLLAWANQGPKAETEEKKPTTSSPE